MTPLATLQARAWAVVALVAEGHPDDVPALLEDLDHRDLTMMVTVMAGVMVQGHVGTNPAAHARLAAQTRQALLDLAAREGPADGDG
ncbi:hypothetical protein [Streptomyces heilongjiangensis]|uniref:TetR family transcriptional regulator n=1 Tax=Streptomyces heilongjiangensis TaxID=945052 RepID=A0ABW1B4U5_9ACTN|nr:hypothetical protein [Streptomyces heilongjiangensis]MDC2951767.1 hypothetical protein [Streptomyces heilongjiangensis]